MSQNSNNPENQEIDLAIISKKIGNFFEDILVSLFKGMLFIKRNLIVILGLIVLGYGLGYFLDKGSRLYNHTVIVTPNFGSVENLYSRVELLNSKIKERDTVFLKSAGFENISSLSAIKIEPIVDIYGFVNNQSGTASNAQNTQNFELVKLLSESADINKVIKEDLTSRNYPNHTITLTTKGFTTSKATIDPILSFLNTNQYYQIVQKTYRNNIHIKMKEDTVMINQINDLLSKISLSLTDHQSDKLVYNNENTQFNELLTTKNNLVSELGRLRIELITTEKIVKDYTRILNTKDTSTIKNKLKFILPLILVFCFIFINIVIVFYKRQSYKMNNKS